jgi:hypothetical protein
MKELKKAFLRMLLSDVLQMAQGQDILGIGEIKSVDPVNGSIVADFHIEQNGKTRSFELALVETTPKP